MFPDKLIIPPGKESGAVVPATAGIKVKAAARLRQKVALGPLQNPHHQHRHQAQTSQVVVAHHLPRTTVSLRENSLQAVKKALALVEPLLTEMDQTWATQKPP